MKLRRGALLCAMAVAAVAVPGVVQAAPSTFDARKGEITIGEVIDILRPGTGERPTRALGVRSELAMTDREARALLDGREVPGFTVLNRVSSPALDTTLNDLGPVVVAKEPQHYEFVFDLGNEGMMVYTNCDVFEQDDGSTLMVCD